jgi:hypothetical protein
LKCGFEEGWKRSLGLIMLRNKKIPERVKEERNILHTVNRRKANLIGNSCIGTGYYNVIEGEIEGRSDSKTKKKT